MNRKGLAAMPALLKFLVPLATFLSASYWNAFVRLSLVAGNQVRVNHLTRLQQSISDTTNEPSREPIHEPTKRLGQDALLPVNLSSTGGLCHDKKSEQVMFSNQGQDNEIQSNSTDSSNTQPSYWQGPKQRSLVISARVPFATFRSNMSSGLNCWVHYHTGFESVTSTKKVSCSVFALLMQQHSIQFACIKWSFISARVLISTFDDLTSSSRMACWVHTLPVKVLLLHQTNHAVPSKWWYKQQHYVPFVSCWDLHQSAKAALKARAEVQASADKIKPYNFSSFND